MKHLFIKSRQEEATETLILLHGTGGRETDLLEVAAMVDNEANILSLRGEIDEHGQSRFFKRLSEKEFDEESLKEEGDKIFETLQSLEKEYDFELKNSVLIGYSNGANMAAYLLLNYPLGVRGAMLMHSAYRSETVNTDMIFDTDILLTAGAQDTVATAGESYKLKQKLENKGAKVTVKLTDGGHNIEAMELMEGHVWFMPIKKALRDEGKLL